MKDEIKEILDDLRTYKDRYEYFLFNNLSFSDRDYKAKILLDYITNLQTIEQQYSAILSENAELENKITNLQEENEIVHKDFAELSERYFFIKSRNEKAIEYIKQHSSLGGRWENDKFIVEYINEVENGMELLNILKGSDG